MSHMRIINSLVSQNELSAYVAPMLVKTSGFSFFMLVFRKRPLEFMSTSV